MIAVMVPHHDHRKEEVSKADQLKRNRSIIEMNNI